MHSGYMQHHAYRIERARRVRCPAANDEEPVAVNNGRVAVGRYGRTVVWQSLPDARVDVKAI